MKCALLERLKVEIRMKSGECCRLLILWMRRQRGSKETCRGVSSGRNEDL